MSRTAWGSQNQVTGPSPYSGELVKAAEQLIESIKPLIEQKKYLRNLLDKASRCVFLRFSGLSALRVAQSALGQVHKRFGEESSAQGDWC